ncbi:hypothetical protein CI105_05635, partial [Candidatus Izimaplasma bacterium ZiA1]|uniref:RHS repeat domain-containing protein n=1 Tax=Candidatus Izimoplasma sp. ZiA1 TaxID=2024899 RepID=UPI000BCD3EF6
MLKRILKPINNNHIRRFVKINKALRKVLAIAGLVAMLGTYVPWNYIYAETNETPTNEVVIEKKNRIKYPTTTDSNFEPSNVGIRSEVVEERTATSKTFRKIDGTYEVAVYDDVVHYNKNGEWKQIDNRFNELDNDIENKSNIFKINFPKKLDDNKMFRIDIENYSIDWNIFGINESSIEYMTENEEQLDLKELKGINSRVQYKNILPNVNLEYVLTGSQIKENLILNEYISDFSMTFEYRLKNLNIIQDDLGKIIFVNDNNETVYRFDDFIMFDKSNNYSKDISYTLTKSGNKSYIIEVTPSDDWMSNANYPINIDPTIVFDDNNYNIRDKSTYGLSNVLDLNPLIIGSSGVNTYRTYFGVKTYFIPDNKNINYAHLSVTSDDNYCTSNCIINLRELDSSYEYDDIVGGYTDFLTSDVVDYLHIKNSYVDKNYKFDITKLIKKWYENNTYEGLLELKIDDINNDEYITFNSMEGSATLSPKLLIGYTDTSGIKDYWTYNEQNLGESGTGYVADLTGKLNFIKNDLNFTTEKQSFGLSLIYNIDRRGYQIGYGLGWRTNYSMEVWYDASLDQYYTYDASRSKVYYSDSVCDTRAASIDSGKSLNCKLAEDGSGNYLVTVKSGLVLENRYILTINQKKFNFGNDMYLDSIQDLRSDRVINVYRDVTYKDHITSIVDDSGNKIDMTYNSRGLYDATLSLKQSNGTFKVVEKVNYYYKYCDFYGGYKLYYTTKTTNYDETSLGSPETTYYYADDRARITSVSKTGEGKVNYTYDSTSNNRVSSIKYYSNNYKIGETTYNYDYQKTTITDVEGNSMYYFFDNYGHSVNIRDDFGYAQFYSYLNLFSVIDIEQFTSGGEEYYSLIDLLGTDQNPNYHNNHKLIRSSEPTKSVFNPVNNHGFEFDNNALGWEYICDTTSSVINSFNGYVTEESVFGEKSAKIEVNGETYGYYEQSIKLKPYETYTISGYVLNKTNSDTNVYLSVDNIDTQEVKAHVGISDEWQYITLQFVTSLDEGEHPIIRLNNYGDGEAYFDNIQVIEGFANTEKNSIDDPSFETVSSTVWSFSDTTNVKIVDNDLITDKLEKDILGDYALEINGSPLTTRYASINDGYQVNDQHLNTQIVVGAWAYSEGTPTSQNFQDVITDNDLRKFRLRVDAYDENNVIITKGYIDFDPSIVGWQYALEKISIPSTTHNVVAYFEYQGAGKVYFDGIQLYYEQVFSEYRYDAKGRTIEKVSKNGEITEFEYSNSDDYRATKITRNQVETVINNNDELALTSYVETNNVRVSINYTDNQPTQMTFGDATSQFSRSTSYLSTGFNQYVQSTTNEFGKTTTYYHDTVTGLLEAVQNAKGEDLLFEYDNEGKLIKATSLADHNSQTNIHGSVEYYYDDKDRISIINIDEGYYYSLEYNNQNQIINVSVNTQSLMSYDYVSKFVNDETIYTSLIDRQTYGNSDEMSFSYNSENQMTEIWFKDANESMPMQIFGYKYDQNGLVAVLETYENGLLNKQEFYTYDSAGRLIKVVDDSKNEIRYGYGDSGEINNLSFTIDGNTSDTNYFHNLCSEYIDNECTTKTSLYDYTEYEANITSSPKVKKDYNYEDSSFYRLEYINLIVDNSEVPIIKENYNYIGDNNRLFSVTYNVLNKDIKYLYIYDELGNITRVQHYENNIKKLDETYKYDELNQMIEENMQLTSADCTVVSDLCYTKYYKYDQKGNLTDILHYPLGNDEMVMPVIPSYYIRNYGDSNVRMVYNNIYDYNDIYSLNVGQSPSITFKYYDKNTGVLLTNLNTVKTYDNLDTTKVGYYYHKYEASYNMDYILLFKIIFKVGDPQPTINIPYEHTRYYYSSSWEDQLLGVKRITYNQDGTEIVPAAYKKGYIYDSQGNPTRINGFTYNSIIYDHAVLSYDGRQLTKIQIYNLYNSLISTITYKYNDQGYRTSKTINNTTIDYTLSGDKVLYETNGTYSISYTYDYNGKIISFNYDNNKNDSTKGDEYFYIRNQQGDIKAITDITGEVVVTYEYDAWGNILEIDGSLGTSIGVLNPYRYRGYRYDNEISLYYLNS